MNAVEFENVSFTYGKNKLLNGLNLQLVAGAFHVLLGSNGAGKTTIFNLIAGLLVPQSGAVRLYGENAHRVVYRDMGVVFQQSSLDAELTVEQNLRYFAALHGQKITRKQVTEHLREFDLAEFSHQIVGTLSGGQKRRVEIIRALWHRPKLLLMDEPTTGLDMASKEQITQLAHDFIKQGVTVLWLTHLLDEIDKDDHIHIIEKGQLCEQGYLAELGGVDAIKARYTRVERATL